MAFTDVDALEGGGKVLGHQCLHITFGVWWLDLGGLERVVLDLVRVFCEQGHRISVICIERPGKLADQAAWEGAEIYSLDKPPGRFAESVSKAADLLQRLQPDVVHTHQIGALWYLGQAAHRLGVDAVVHTEHSDHVAQTSGWWGKVKMRLRWQRAARFARRFCCVSDDIARSARRWGTVPGSKVQTVLNGINVSIGDDRAQRGGVRESLGFADEHKVVGTVGRLAEVKRQDLLLGAFRKLASQFDLARLLIVGDGPERSRLENLAKDLQISEKVVFAGYQSHPERYLHAMDMFALTSRHEGLPLSLLEACAVGLPVVSSSVGGVPRVVEHGRTGLLFRSGETDALASSLSRLVVEEGLAKSLGDAAQAEVRANYSLERMAENYAIQYQQVLSGKTSQVSGAING